MAEMIPLYYRELYEMNLAILQMAREARWDDFIEVASRYVIKKQDIFNNSSDALSASEKEALKALLQQLLDNEAEITRNLRARLDTLKQNLSSIHRGARCSQLYTLHQAPSLH
ncbi:flagellar protein FliT [Kosakonia sp. SMBL-WEM22]|uniref:flagellar protein FliT n=1 Tax=Kosakonia sp. SMBL-WEM22 TaxID=2725560 RepID=UPI001659014C|nr:flagellar protein FliT [Kosakonia sp. SMBL-WEM22]MDV5353376.1 flagellar protein FliT [Enterobacter asburiae]QNQ21564.1 flagellar protein FliT [Kosakonia sp. SMBL-WEM22]